MAFAIERRLAPFGPAPALGVDAAGQRDLEIGVVFTSTESTIQALKTAGALANRLNGSITLVVPQVVAYPLPLDSPPVLVDFNERRFRVIAEQSPVDMVVRIYLCRDKLEMLTSVLKPHSLLVLGLHKTWWPTAEKRLAAKLRRAGHEVILAETE